MYSQTLIFSGQTVSQDFGQVYTAYDAVWHPSYSVPCWGERAWFCEHCFTRLQTPDAAASTI